METKTYFILTDITLIWSLISGKLLKRYQTLVHPDIQMLSAKISPYL